jgi:hypothetical protein
MNGWQRIEWVLAVVEEKHLSANAGMVLLSLCKYADNATGVCWPAQSTLRRHTNLSQGQMRRALQELRAKAVMRILTVSRTPGKGKEFNCSITLTARRHVATLNILPIRPGMHSAPLSRLQLEMPRANPRHRRYSASVMPIMQRRRSRYWITTMCLAILQRSSSIRLRNKLRKNSQRSCPWTNSYASRHPI